MTTFADLNLIDPLLRALAASCYEHPTPIQAQAIPPLLEGRDLLGCAQTGTGKTAAFALPILQHLSTRRLAGARAAIRALVLSPTRELAAQIDASFRTYGQYLRLRHLAIFGGVSERPQIQALRLGTDVLVATPGRLLDLLDRGYVDLSSVECFVLDEADRMLDMGFIHDIQRVMRRLPRQRQNLLFSATLPLNIVDLARSFLHQPVTVRVDPESVSFAGIAQQVVFVPKPDKPRLMAELLSRDDVDRALVFTRTKHGANRLTKTLGQVGLRVAAIHGNKSQNERTRALAGFKRGDIRVLVATDIASRGIDVEGITHVFNYDISNDPEVHVHRIGRTGRAGRQGVAISLCDPSERVFLRDIERLLGSRIPVAHHRDGRHAAGSEPC